MSRERVSPNGLRKHESGTGQPPFANLAVLNMSQERFFVFAILAALQPGIWNRSFEIDKISRSDALLPDLPDFRDEMSPPTWDPEPKFRNRQNQPFWRPLA